MFGNDCPSLIPDSVISKIIIFFHGYGSNGDDLLEIGKIWQPNLLNTAFYAPNGIEQCDINPYGGYQWFGLKDLSFFNIRQGLDKHKELLKKEISNLLKKHKLVASDVIFVGFSQGSMLALDLIFSFENLGGVVAYSGAFYPPENVNRISCSPPVLLVHGTADSVVPYAMMQSAESALLKMGVNVTSKTVKNLAHSIDSSGISAGLEFIKFQHKNQPIAL